MAISFSEQTFKTQKDVQQFIKSTIDQCAFLETIDEKHKFFVVYMALLKIHFNRLDKEGDGVKHFFFSPNMYGHKELQICRLDDSIVSMSCSYAKIRKDKNPYQELRSALRYSIADQTLEFRQKQIYPFHCVMCWTQVKTFQVDHIYPFSMIVQEFLNETQIKVPDIFYKNKHNMLEFLPTDKEFEDTWKIYHKNKSTYQILCIHCNIQKSDKIISE